MTMPHQFSQDRDIIECPPNCPYSLWQKIKDLPGAEIEFPGYFGGQARTDYWPDTQGWPHEWQLTTQENIAQALVREKDVAYTFLRQMGLDPTPDAIEQLTKVFIPCLRIMCDPDHPWDPEGGTWRKGGIFSVLTDAKKKWERFWERTWKHGKRHDDSGYDLINFVAFVLRSDPDSRWGDWGDPG